jgi:hypothetical protein
MAFVDCPTCGGTGRARTVGRRGAEPVILDTKCATCDGKGKLEVVSHDPAPPPPPQTNKPPPPPDIWSLAIMFGLFAIFFLWLWI